MRVSAAYQPSLPHLEIETITTPGRPDERSGAFTDNMSLPVHRWFRYSAGFSADWVRALVREYRVEHRGLVILDPFGGVGTTLLACDAEDVSSWGFESHPFVHRVAQAKLLGVHADLELLQSTANDLLRAVQPATLVSDPPSLLKRCYTPDSLETLLAIKEAFLTQFDDHTPESELVWLAITAILRTCSGAGTAQWQYVLPNKSKAVVQAPMQALQAKLAEIMQDVHFAQAQGWAAKSHMLQTDARAPQGCSALQVDAVITSPPYPNNYDYADATRLEMTFWGEVSGWGDLQEAVRRYLIHSCSQHSAAERLVLGDLLRDDALAPIREPLTSACTQLAELREERGGKKTYHTMAAAYFRDLSLVFRALRPLCRSGSEMCFVIGDSAPYGVYLHVDEWLGQLALAAGFESYSFEKIRDRNTKWKNRKHRVPLKEGRLWIRG